MNYDVIILGAGAAGTAAAMLLRARGLQSLLVERAAKPGKKPHQPDWASMAAIEILEQSGIPCGELRGRDFTGLAYHSADLKKTAAANGSVPVACRIDYAQLVEHMQRTARDAQIEIKYQAEPMRIDLAEKCVRIEQDGAKPLEAGFLLLADGAARTFVNMGPGQAPPVVVPPSPKVTGRWVAALSLGAGSGKSRAAKAAADDSMHWLVGLDRDKSCLLWWWDGPALIVTLLAAGTGEAVSLLLLDKVAQLAKAGLLGDVETVTAAAVMLRPAPARCALEIESHVDKRCLLIGDAGGFISETSGEGLYPAVWSARLAVDSIVAARTSPHPQDQLRQFSTTWRSSIAEYLRPPHTDMHFLLPLIFSNKQMAERMAGAFWCGQNL